MNLQGPVPVSYKLQCIFTLQNCIRAIPVSVVPIFISFCFRADNCVINSIQMHVKTNIRLFHIISYITYLILLHIIILLSRLASIIQQDNFVPARSLLRSSWIYQVLCGITWRFVVLLAIRYFLWLWGLNSLRTTKFFISQLFFSLLSI